MAPSPRALYAGTFDPMTLGHLDLIKRGLQLFDSLVVGLARNSAKTPLFTVEQRMDMIREEVRNLSAVSVDSFSGLVVDYCRKNDIQVLLRGVRTVTDFEYEYRMALTNRALHDGVETVFLMPNEQYSYLSSTLIKEVYAGGADLKRFLSPRIHQLMLERLQT